MKWCYVSDIDAHLDDIATDIRANLEKTMAYDALMARKEEIKQEEAKLAKHEANIAEFRKQIDELHNKMMQEVLLASEAEGKISALKEEFWK